MSLSNQQCWIIKKGEYYVNANFKALFTGRTSGFVGYIEKDRMQIDLDKLGGLEKGYYCEQVNLNEVPRGERVYT